MKKLLLLVFLLILFEGISQTTHKVTVAVNQGDPCAVVNGLDETSLFKIFPNPATKSFVVQTDLKDSEIQLFDLNGKRVRSRRITKGKTEINIEGLPRGIYFLHFQNGFEIEKTKIKIQ